MAGLWDGMSKTLTSSFIYAAENRNNYDLSANGVNIPANTSFADRVTFATGLSSAAITVTVSGAAPTTVHTFDLDTSDTSFTGTATVTHGVNSNATTAMNEIRSVLSGLYGPQNDELFISQPVTSGNTTSIIVTTGVASDLTFLPGTTANSGTNTTLSASTSREGVARTSYSFDPDVDSAKYPVGTLIPNTLLAKTKALLKH